MRGATLFLALLCACGGPGPLTNNGLEGTRVSAGDGCSMKMQLLPGEHGVFGTVEGCVTATVSTLPDLFIRWTAPDRSTQDFHVMILETCPGEPRPVYSRLHDIALTSTTLPPIPFARDAPPPLCSGFLGP